MKNEEIEVFKKNSNEPLWGFLGSVACVLIFFRIRGCEVHS